MDDICRNCGKSPLSSNERGLCLKYLGRGTTEFLCMGCLAQTLGTTVLDLEHMIFVFRTQGCRLFPPLMPGETDPAADLLKAKDGGTH